MITDFEIIERLTELQQLVQTVNEKLYDLQLLVGVRLIKERSKEVET